jgi:hypothetical protein
MVHHAAMYALFAPDLPENQRTRQMLAARFQALDVLPIPWVETADTSNAVLFLASAEARYITGVALPVDAGVTLKWAREDHVGQRGASRAPRRTGVSQRGVRAPSRSWYRARSAA